MKPIYSLEPFLKFIRLACLISSFLFANLSFAQVGILSSIDIYWGSVKDPATYALCIASETDKYRCGANVEVIDLSRFNLCNDVQACLTNYAYHIPFVPIELTQTMESELLKLYAEYKIKVQQILQEEIDKRGDCIPIICSDPSPQPNCIAQAVTAATGRVLAEVLPWYWQEVYRFAYQILPTALHWQNPALPNQGAIIQPFFTSVAKPGQLAQLGASLRQQLYYHQPNTLDVQIPYIPNELHSDYGGIEDFEREKVRLEPATLFEYQQFGFSSLYLLVGSYKLELTWGLAFGFCATIFPPSIQPRFAPIPLLTNIWLADSEVAVVPEGYPIPYIEGEPILYPF